MLTHGARDALRTSIAGTGEQLRDYAEPAAGQWLMHALPARSSWPAARRSPEGRWRQHPGAPSDLQGRRKKAEEDTIETSGAPETHAHYA